jgi:hypothetical protein
MSWWHYKNAKASAPAAGARPHIAAKPRSAAQPVSVDSQRVAQPEPEAVRPADDPAEKILRGDPNMTDEGRATAWDIFHAAKDHLDLAQRIQHVEMLNDTRHRLWEAKKTTAAPVDPVSKVRAAIEQVAQMDPAALEVAERHPTVLKLFGDAMIPKGKAK